MTQAFNLSQLANKVNTSGQLDVSTGATGTLPSANLPTVPISKGGTGLTTIGANGTVLSSDGTNASWAAAASGYAGTSSQIYAAPATWTVPTGITKAKVTVIGGGGGGGPAGAPSGQGNGRGGGAGGISINWFTGLTPGGTVAVTVGSGGGAGVSGQSSSFGPAGSPATTLTATGGAGNGPGLGGTGTGYGQPIAGTSYSNPAGDSYPTAGAAVVMANAPNTGINFGLYSLYGSAGAYRTPPTAATTATNGGGGAGGYAPGGAGTAGANGVVIIEY
jgi:hypothetical protein